MNPTQHELCNRVLLPPEGVNDVRPLAVVDTELGGHPAIASFWKPDAQELAQLNAGNPIAVFVMGHTHPPLWLGVAAPPKSKPIVVGSRVMTTTTCNYFKAGDTGTVERVDKDGDLWVKFDMGNHRPRTHDLIGGVWCVAPSGVTPLLQVKT